MSSPLASSPIEDKSIEPSQKFSPLEDEEPIFDDWYSSIGIKQSYRPQNKNRKFKFPKTSTERLEMTHLILRQKKVLSKLLGYPMPNDSSAVQIKSEIEKLEQLAAQDPRSFVQESAQLTKQLSELESQLSKLQEEQTQLFSDLKDRLNQEQAVEEKTAASQKGNYQDFFSDLPSIPMLSSNNPPPPVMAPIGMNQNPMSPMRMAPRNPGRGAPLHHFPSRRPTSHPLHSGNNRYRSHKPQPLLPHQSNRPRYRPRAPNRGGFNNFRSRPNRGGFMQYRSRPSRGLRP